MNSLKRTISLREATTTDGYTLIANKHFTNYIENGTLYDAVSNGFIKQREAIMIRFLKSKQIAWENMQNTRRNLSDTAATEETTAEPKEESVTVADADDEAEN